MSVLEITAEQYQEDDVDPSTPTLSSSIANVLLRFSPAHAYAAHPKLGNTRISKSSDAFDLGDAVHGLLLEGDDRIVEVDAKDWKTKAAQEQRAEARAHGYVPMLIEQADRCRQMVNAVREQLLRFDADPPLLDPAGAPEQTIVWTDRGVKCRALVDWLHPVAVKTADDVKTTSGNGGPEAWSRGAFYKFGYDVQSAFHLRGLAELVGRGARFRYIVAEAESPFEVAVYEPGADVLAVANAKIDYAIDRWRECLESGVWPGYPKRVATIELPPWEEARWLEREMRDE